MNKWNFKLKTQLSLTFVSPKIKYLNINQTKYVKSHTRKTTKVTGMKSKELNKWKSIPCS